VTNSPEEFLIKMRILFARVVNSDPTRSKMFTGSVPRSILVIPNLKSDDRNNILNIATTRNKGERN